MVNKCIVNTCNTVKAGDGVTMHPLPADPQFRNVWFHALLDKTGQTVFREGDEICSKHFSSESFGDVDGISVLKADAVPFNFRPDNENFEDETPRAKRLKNNETVSSQCSVFSCKNVSNETLMTQPNLTYYPFPKSKALLTSWKQFCNKTDDDFSQSFVCSDHFTPNDFTNKTETSTGSHPSNTLKPNAIPSIYKTEIKCEEFIEEGEEVITPQNVLQMNFVAGDNIASPTLEDKICGIENCEFKAGERNDVEYYPMPIQANTRKAWIKLIQSQTKQVNMPPNAFICSAHFSRECFRIDGKTQKKILLSEAVPSIFPTPIIDMDEFPALSQNDFTNPERVKGFYTWCLANHQDQKKYIQFLKERYSIQAKRIARLAKSVDDFKAKKAVSEEANAALQILFDNIIDAQYDVI